MDHEHQTVDKRLHAIAVKWLLDRANPEDDGGLGVFADTRFCIDLTKLLQRVERAATKRAQAELMCRGKEGINMMLTGHHHRLRKSKDDSFPYFCPDCGASADSGIWKEAEMIARAKLPMGTSNEKAELAIADVAFEIARQRGRTTKTGRRK